MPRQSVPDPPPAPAPGSTEHVLEVFEEVRKRIEGFHMPDFLGIDITMPQAKILLLAVSEGQVSMSRLAARLGVSLSTISGHVDRLVDHGLVARGEDPTDRRQVVLTPTAAAIELAERFHDFNVTQLRQLLDRMTRSERLDVARAFSHIARVVDEILLAGTPRADPTTTVTRPERTAP
jgi:DNA-binding MarR family transcriptional regulator